MLMANISKHIKALLHSASGHQANRKDHQAGSQIRDVTVVRNIKCNIISKSPVIKVVSIYILYVMICSVMQFGQFETIYSGLIFRP